MTRSRALALLLSAVLSPAARAASADPSLMPEFESHRKAPAPAEAERPAPSGDAPPAAPSAPAAPARHRRPDRIEEEPAPRRPWIVAHGRYWFVSGNQESRYGTIAPSTVLQVVSGTGDPWTGSTANSRLRGKMPIAELEIAPFERLSILGEYGAAGVSGRFGRTDWVDAQHADVLLAPQLGVTLNSPNHVQSGHLSASAVSARTTWASASLALRVVDNRGASIGRMEYDHSVDVLLGAERFTDEYTVYDAIVDADSGIFPAAHPVGFRFPGYVQRVSSAWRGPHAGLRLAASTPNGFHLEALVLWSPLMEYRGDLYDNVNAGGSLRPNSPNILERAHGVAFHQRFGASWRWEAFSLEAGYMHMYFYSRTGLRRSYAPDGTSTDAQLDRAMVERSGFYAGASARF